jgi:hypothetical protein
MNDEEDHARPPSFSSFIVPTSSFPISPVRSSTAERGAHNPEVVGSIPAAPMQLGTDALRDSTTGGAPGSEPGGWRFESFSLSFRIGQRRKP